MSDKHHLKLSQKTIKQMDTNLGQVVLVEDINPGISQGYNGPVRPIDFFMPDDSEAESNEELDSSADDETRISIPTSPYPDSSFPSSLIEFNDKLYFSADDGENGRELFVSDGTAEGTQLVVDLRPGEGNYGYIYGSNPYNLVEFNDKLYFSADDGESGRELFVSDGTAEGTQLLVDLYPGENNYNYTETTYPYTFIDINYLLDFPPIDGESGYELFVSDGTAEGTQLLVDLYPGENKYGFTNSSDPSSLVEFDDKLYFTANDGESGGELFVTDGTAEGTQLVTDLYPGVSQYGYSYGSNPYELTVVGDELFFRADNGETGTELFKLTLDDSVGETPALINGSDGSDNLCCGEEVLATFDGINTEQLTTSSDFETI